VKSVGTLGQYLSSARELKGFDLHDAAQQTRISIQYLKALESEDFAKLPGEVFVRGFLKNYAKFLGLPEQDVLNKYGELRHAAAGAAVVSPQPAAAEQAPAPQTQEKPSKVSLEPWLWGTVIFISIVGFLFMAAPEKQQDPVAPLEEHTAVLHTESTSSALPAKPEKLYLQIVALEDVWLLVRTDTGPQKKAVLKKDENVVWIADERFLLSYGSVGAAKLLLKARN
jgi:cytoskeletal protein RodZ